MGSFYVYLREIWMFEQNGVAPDSKGNKETGR